MVGTYSQINLSEVDITIQAQLDDVVEILQSYREQIGLESVLLVGSFGRGEGAVLIENNTIKPLNDYDFLLCTKNHGVSPFLTNEISKKIAAKTGLQRIDLNVICSNYVPKMPNTIYYYEAKYGSRLLWGEDFRKKFPNYVPEKIPLWDGAFLLFARTVALSLAYPPSSENNERFAKEQCLKAILACSEAMLILTGNYHFSYRERLEKVKKTFSNDSHEYLRQLVKLDELATQFKMRPNYNDLPGLDQLWSDVANVYWQIFLHYMANAYNCKPELDLIVQKFLKSHSGLSIKNFVVWFELWRKTGFSLTNLNTKNVTTTPMILVCCSLPYLLKSMMTGDNTYKKGFKYVEKISPINESLSISEVAKNLIATWETIVH